MTFKSQQFKLKDGDKHFFIQMDKVDMQFYKDTTQWDRKIDN